MYPLYIISSLFRNSLYLPSLCCSTSSYTFLPCQFYLPFTFPLTTQSPLHLPFAISLLQTVSILSPSTIPLLIASPCPPCALLTSLWPPLLPPFVCGSPCKEEYWGIILEGEVLGGRSEEVASISYLLTVLEQ